MSKLEHVNNPVVDISPVLPIPFVVNGSENVLYAKNVCDAPRLASPITVVDFRTILLVASNAKTPTNEATEQLI